MHISSFGVVIKKLRLEQKFTQEKLASISGLERTFVSMLERGIKQPSLKTISSLAMAFHLRSYELLHLVEQEIHLANGGVNSDEALKEDQRRLDKLESEQEKLRISEIADSIPIVFFARSTLPEHALTFVSKNIRQLFGYDVDSFMENHAFWQAHIHQDDLPKVLDYLKNMNANESLHYEYRFLTAQGQWLQVREELKLVVDKFGIAKELIGMVSG
jgi:transcriptional regulator with XRE-family HTH domain